MDTNQQPANMASAAVPQGKRPTGWQDLPGEIKIQIYEEAWAGRRVFPFSSTDATDILASLRPVYPTFEKSETEPIRQAFWKNSTLVIRSFHELAAFAVEKRDGTLIEFLEIQTAGKHMEAWPFTLLSFVLRRLPDLKRITIVVTGRPPAYCAERVQFRHASFGAELLDTTSDLRRCVAILHRWGDGTRPGGPLTHRTVLTDLFDRRAFAPFVYSKSLVGWKQRPEVVLRFSLSSTYGAWPISQNVVFHPSVLGGEHFHMEVEFSSWTWALTGRYNDQEFSITQETTLLQMIRWPHHRGPLDPRPVVPPSTLNITKHQGEVERRVCDIVAELFPEISPDQPTNVFDVFDCMDGRPANLSDEQPRRLKYDLGLLLAPKMGLASRGNRLWRLRPEIQIETWRRVLGISADRRQWWHDMAKDFLAEIESQQTNLPKPRTERRESPRYEIRRLTGVVDNTQPSHHVTGDPSRVIWTELAPDYDRQVVFFGALLKYGKDLTVARLKALLRANGLPVE